MPVNSHFAEQEILLFQKSISQGNQSAFRTIFNHFTPRLIVFAKSFVSSQDAAIEIVDNVFVKIWTNKEQIIKIRNLQVYLYTAVKNASFSFLINQAKGISVDPLNNIQIEATVDYNPETQIISAELHQKIQIAINALPPRCKIIFLMIRETGLKYEEVAQTLGISAKTVDAQMTLAVKKIHESVVKTDPNFPSPKKIFKKYFQRH